MQLKKKTNRNIHSRMMTKKIMNFTSQKVAQIHITKYEKWQKAIFIQKNTHKKEDNLKEIKQAYFSSEHKWYQTNL